MLITNSAKGHLIALMTVIIWGITYISTKLLLDDFKPIEILFFRFLLGYITLWILYPHRLPWQGFKQELLFIGAGFCGITCYFLCENIALTYTTASNVGVITCLAPIFTAILAILFLKKEVPSTSFYLGCLCAMMGIGLISFNGAVVLSLNPIGDLLAVLATFFWASYSILTKIGSGYVDNIFQLTRRFFFYGLMFMLPLFPIFDFQWHFSRFADPKNLFNLIFLGIGASAICFASWNYAVKLVGAVKISLYIYLIPIITIITAVLILGEKFTWLAALGTLLTLCGLLLSEGKFVILKQIIFHKKSVIHKKVK
ncbi:DMT family transporter [Orbaceae bacterium ESL0721]|nr:DMT family transporter [Orbaceae bacterium ESL0721]